MSNQIITFLDAYDKPCEVCGESTSSNNEAINHLIDQHSYKLIHVGQQTIEELDPDLPKVTHHTNYTLSLI
jgi:hypothetical protein